MDALSRDEALRLAGFLSVSGPVPEILARAAEFTDVGFGNVVTYSPKVFIPLTKLCRDVCYYCTFARPPIPGRRAYMTIEEVLEVARAGAAAGCREALFTLGDKPELRYKAAREELEAMGYATTLDYLEHAARTVMEDTGLLPHLNPGVMTFDEIVRLREVAPSMGLMMESVSPRLMQKGMPHYGSPDKEPSRRLQMLEDAGRARVPFTTGLLIGIGETWTERAETLFAIRESHQRWGHVQEVIVQNFRAKPNTPMHNHPEPSDDEMVATIALARLILGPHVSVQAPPNLASSDDALRRYIDAGINDWGGVSPVTIDHVNPEAPWPDLDRLQAITESCGAMLLPRLTVYPQYAFPPQWIHKKVRPYVLKLADTAALSREEGWYAGDTLPPPNRFTPPANRFTSPATVGGGPLPKVVEGVPDERAWDESFIPFHPKVAKEAAAEGVPPSATVGQVRHQPRSYPSSLSQGRRGGQPLRHPLPSRPAGVPFRTRPGFESALDKAIARRELNEDEITHLFTARGPELEKLITAADDLRREVNGDQVTFVITRNINYTNMCYFRCGFCAFSKGPKSLNLRGEPYLLSFEEVAQRTIEAREKGATEVCMQGGIHPSFTGDFYIDVLKAVKQAVPGIHVHAFSPLEVWQGAQTKGVTVRDFLWELKDNGLGTLPGTAAEVLDDEVRAIICPDKINTEQWSFVAKTAHSLGLKMTTTLMFGHADTYRSWARHLMVLRDIQKDTQGFTEFVPLPFVHMASPIYLHGKARRGPTFEEALKVHAVGRLALHPWITNVQVSWVKMGLQGAQAALNAGCNDLGGTLMNENISRAAGASHGQELTPEMMKELATEIGRPWARRNTVYEILETAATPAAV